MRISSPPPWVAASAAVALFSVLGRPVSRADETTRAAQSVLVERGFYFGAPDGQPGPTTADALRRFQIREGLPITGKLDHPTARSLGLEGGSGTGQPLKPPPPSAPANADADRDFLRENGLTTQPSPAPAPRRASPPPPRPAPAPVARRPAVNPAEPNVFTNVPPAGRPQPPRRASPAITVGEAAEFLRRYLAAGASDDPGPELGFFAPEVDYFNYGTVRRRFIERDQITYRRRWPYRRYRLEGEPELRGFDDNSAGVRYGLSYEVQSPARVTSGRVEAEVRIRRRPGGGDFEIVSIKEIRR